MYFKRLELFGFKSFAERTRLDFERGVTAIVGPNGCGKTNILDSIKWVLGEQSAKMMRGGKMEDVIFNGTDSKEPVSYAEVSLTLFNHDRLLPIEYDEVTVTRRLYRSGESEYLLNKTPVRLKDISELFMGTGIGTSAYSVIEQGRIDQILSSNPEERREVFEEASGITKFKSKKKEALRRLEDTEHNLLRLNDIIAEVKRQITSIERQAKKAERYKEKYEELKDEELKLSRIELELLKQRLSHSNDNLDVHRLRASELNVELQKWASKLSELNTEKSQFETKRMDFKSSIMEIDSEISNSMQRLSLNRERIEELKKRCIDLESEIKKDEERSSAQQKEVASLREKVDILDTENVQRSTLLSQKEKRLNEISKSMIENEMNISTSKANIIDIASKEAKFRNQLAKVSTTISTDVARLKRLETEKLAVLDERNNLDAKLSEVIEEIGAIEKANLSLTRDKDKISQAISGLISRIGELVQEAKEVGKSLATNKSRLEVLEEAKAKYEGFSSGVRAILSKMPNEKQSPIGGVRDVLVNLLSVKKGYELAIESVLGDYLQAIIVDTMESGEAAVTYLKENSYSKVLFIHPGSFGIKEQTSPKLPWLDSSAKAGALLKDPRLLGKAIDFVSIDEDFRGIIECLLKDVFIVKNLEDAKSLLKDNVMESSTIVTLVGELVGKGFISGGVITKEGATLINRDAQIKELSAIISELEKNLSRSEEENLKNEKEKAELEKRLGDINARLNEKGILFANAKSRHANIEENIKGIEDEISLVELEIDEVKDEMQNFRDDELSLTEALARIEQDARLNEGRIKTSEQLTSKYTKEKEQLLIEIAEQRTELGSLDSKKDGISNTLNILEFSLKDVERALKSRQSEKEDSIRKVEELDEDILNLELNIKTVSEEKIHRNMALKDVEKSYSEILEKSQHCEGLFRQQELEINELRSTLHEADVKKLETNYSIDSLKQRIKDVYKLDLDEIQIVEEWQKIERDSLRKDIEEKREKLDALGPVNLVAIEEHTELQDRWAFLINQRDDLIRAKEDLLKAIAKINKTTKELFIETFKNIQVEFRNFFKMLFGGGDGELILLDESNILESGIEIVARPPGKKLQNVSLLSGGEKALTAIALIFAIFKVKPSPFCVLDEIDAPLDESNIDRFSNALELFTKASQFIIITHNKKTIDMADIMYGITMQESGVSKVVSVKFSDAKKEETVGVDTRR